MKTLIRILMIIGTLMPVSSCTGSGYSVTKEKIISDVKILSEHIEMIDNQLYLQISEADAIELGVSPESYKEVEKELIKGNQILKEIADAHADDPNFKIGYQKDSDFSGTAD